MELLEQPQQQEQELVQAQELELALQQAQAQELELAQAQELQQAQLRGPEQIPHLPLLQSQFPQRQCHLLAHESPSTPLQ
jgi:hypothetical protein